MTHDSIGLGEDGPTHQPVEHLAALRAIPDMQVLRPADAIETAECWQLALETRTGPTSWRSAARTCRPLRSRRQKPLRPRRLHPGRRTADPIRLIASGSEVRLPSAHAISWRKRA